MANTRKTTAPSLAADAVNAVDIDALLDAAAPPERTVSVCLRGDLYVLWQRLEDELQKAIVAGSTSMGGNPEADAIAVQVRDLEAQMRASTLDLRFRAVPKSAFDEMRLANPARPGNRVDAQSGYDTDAVNKALIQGCCVEPELTEDRWTKLVGALTTAQYLEVIGTVNELNFGAVEIPFSFAASSRSLGSEGK